MVAPDREHAIAPEEVQVALSGGVDQVRALPPGPHLVEAQRAQDPSHLRVQETVVEDHLLAAAGVEDLAYGRRRGVGHEQSVCARARGARGAVAI